MNSGQFPGSHLISFLTPFLLSSFFLFLLSFLSVKPAYAASNFEEKIRSALEFISYYQTTGNEGYEAGQWRSQVTSYTPSALGIGRFAEPFEDPTVFVASSVANVLAETFEIDARYTEIPFLLRRTAEGLEKFRWGDLFNFYPWRLHHGVKTGGPRFMYLAPRLRGAMFVPPDSDTTAVTYTFLHYLDSIKKNISPQEQNISLPIQVTKSYGRFLDTNRKPHPFNAIQRQKNTGAFLTWLADEKNPAMPSTFAPPEKGPRIPLHINDVDCVVNANVIKLMTYAGKTSTPGYQSTCNYLNKLARKKRFFYCGMYYPSSYVLPYTMATDLKAGASCLRPAKDQILDYIISKQHNNGSWRNHLLARPDYIQSTAWALNTLMILGNPENRIHRQRVKRGLQFLLSQARRDSGSRLYWSGQVFYAGPLISRYPIVWRSTAYTTALAIKALTLADNKWNL